MKRYRALIVAMTFAGGMGSETVIGGAKVGEKAADFTLKGSDGKNYSLSRFKGKKAVVIAWFPRAFGRR